MTRYRLAHRLFAFVRRRPLLAAFTLLLLAAGGVAGTNGLRQGDAPLQADPAHWVPVRPQPVALQLGLLGRIQAAQQETLSAPFQGVVREVMVREDDVVAAGQTLLHLDPGQIEIQMRQAAAELLKAQRLAHQLRNWDSSPEVSRACRAVQSARSTLEATRANLRDTRALFERGIVARMEVDTLTQQLRAQQQDLLSAQDELRTVKARGKGEELKIAEMELANAQARYQAVVEQSERREVTAPFKGVVVRPAVQDGGKAIFAQPGLQVAQGAPLLSVIGLDSIQVLTRVEETDLHQLRKGMPVRITGEGFAGQILTGRVAAMAVQGNAADAPGAAAHYDVVVSVDTPQTEAAQQVRLGMSARLAVILYENEDSIVVPPHALHTDDEGASYVVYRAAPDAVPTKTRVMPGRAFAQGIEVQGLQAGFVLVPADGREGDLARLLHDTTG